MKRVFFLILIITNTVKVIAQSEDRIIVGGTFDLAFKHSMGQHLGLLSYEPSIFIRVEGKELNSLDFIGRVGFVLDPIIYNPSNSDWFYILQNNLSFSGQIRFPTKIENLHILFGIGIEYGIRPAVGYGANSNATTYLTIDLDSTSKKVEEFRRRILPSVSGGLVYQPFKNKKIQLSFVLKQNLLDLFTEDIIVTYNNSGIDNTVVINYRPSYFKLGLSYDFW